MIEVEFRAVPQGGNHYEAIARLVVHDDGTREEWYPQEVIPYDLHALVPGGDALRKVKFEQDPATWARHLRSILRTGYLVPVVTHDDGVG